MATISVASNVYAKGMRALASPTDGSGQDNARLFPGVGSSTVQISPASQFLSKMQQMQVNSPSEFTKLMTTAATQLEQAAQTATGPQATFLTSMSTNFQKAANGDLSGFQQAAQASQEASLQSRNPAVPPLQEARASTNQTSRQRRQYQKHSGSTGDGSAVAQMFSGITSALNGLARTSGI